MHKRFVLLHPRNYYLALPLQSIFLHLLSLGGRNDPCDGYYVAYTPITLSCILFMFIEMIFIYCHSCVMFVMKSMCMCNDEVNYDEIII